MKALHSLSLITKVVLFWLGIIRVLLYTVVLEIST